MSYGVFEDQTVELEKEAERRNLASTRLAQAASEVDEQLGPFLSKSESKQDYLDRVALSKDSLREIVGKYLVGDFGVDAVVNKLEPHYLGQKKKSDHWESDVEFQKFLLDLYGTTDVTQEQLVEALECYSGVGQQEAIEEAAPEIEHLSRKREASRRAVKRKSHAQSRRARVSELAMDPRVITKVTSNRKLSSARLAQHLRHLGHNVGPRTASEIRDRVISETKHLLAFKSTLENQRTAFSGDWTVDPKLNAYVSLRKQSFKCECGNKHPVPSYAKCACGRLWNSYTITSRSTGEKLFVAREVPVRDVVLASRKKTSSDRLTFGERLLKFMGWTPAGTERTDWDSPSGNVSFFAHQGIAVVYEPNGGNIQDTIPVDDLEEGELLQLLQELEGSSW